MSVSPCVRSPSIRGDLAPAWSFTLGEGNAGGAKLDPHGNLIVVGSVFDALTVRGQTFDGPANSTDHPFAMALDPGGNLLWHRIFDDNWQPTDLALDAAGNIYVVGTQGQFVPTPADLGTGPIPGPAVLAKLDGQGNTIWSHGIPDVIDPLVDQVSLALAVDPSGNIAIAGQSYGPSTLSFIAGYDTNGTFRWKLGPGEAVPLDLAFDGAGNLVVVGNFEGTLDWGPPLTAQSSAFVLKLDAAHNVLSSVALGDYTVATALAVEGTKTYVAGTFSGSLTLGGTTSTSQGVADLFIATFDDGAQPVASLTAHFAAGNDRLGALTPDGAGGLWALGQLGDFVDFGAGPASPSSAVALHLEATGQVVTSGVFPQSSSASSQARSVVADASGNVWLHGTFSRSFDLGSGVLSEPATDVLGSDLYLAKYTAASTAIASPSCPPASGALLDSNGSIMPKAMSFAGAELALTTGTETATVPLGGGRPSLLALAQKDTIALTVHGQTIYWANAGTPPWLLGPGSNGSIVSMPVSGGAPTVLAAGLQAPSAMAADDTNVYWTTAGPQVSGGPATPVGALMAVPIGGGTPTTLAGGFAYVGPVAAANGVVVFAAGAAAETVGTPATVQILKVTAAGGDVTPLASTDRDVTDIVLDAANVYWTESNSPTVDVSNNDGQIARAALDGTSNRVLLLGNQPAPYGLSLLGGTLTWCNSGGFDNGQTENSAGVWSMPATGGNPTAIVSGLPGLAACAADSTHLAWIAPDGSGVWKLVIQER